MTELCCYGMWAGLHSHFLPVYSFCLSSSPLLQHHSQPGRHTNAPGSKPIAHSSVVGRITQALEPGRPGCNSELRFWLFKQSNNNYKCFAYSVFAYDCSNCKRLSSNVTRVTSSEKISFSWSFFFFFPLHITFPSLKLF